MKTSLKSQSISVVDVSKQYGATVALDRCNLGLDEGEVHGLIGANGAGKSTLVRILSGATVPDSGVLTIGGWSGETLNPRQAQELGIATIYQDPDLVPGLTAAENIALGREQRKGHFFVDRRREWSDALDAARRVGLAGRTAGQTVERMSRAEQQLVEIAKALHREARVILMDEPTAPLGPEDSRRLLDVIRELAVAGVCVLYITHRLREAQAVCDRITVLRDGRKVWTRATPDLDQAEILKAMIGHGLEMNPRSKESTPGEVVLEVEELGQGGRVSEISLRLRAGEIVGLAGLVGAGRSRVLRLLAGALRPDTGTMLLRGKHYRPRTPAEAVSRGVALITDDRKGDGLFLDMSVANNLTFANPVSRAGLVRLRQDRLLAASWVKRLLIKPPDVRLPVRSLSGGNQQKVLMARWLNAGVEVLLVDEPGQGIDVSGKEEFYGYLRNMAQQGKAILFSSSESEELFALADELIIMRQGRIVAQRTVGTITEQQMIELASIPQGENGVQLAGRQT